MLNCKIVLACLFLLTALMSCRQGIEKQTSSPGTEAESVFDRTKWSTREGQDYPYRDKMLHDVVYNDTIRRLKQIEILELLGEPDRIHEGFFYYNVTQKRLGKWPLHTKTMVVKFAGDSIEWIKIHE